MEKQTFVEYLNPKDGKTYLVTVKEDRDIKFFSLRFLFVLALAFILHLTNRIQPLYIVFISVLLVVVLEFLNFRFRVKLFSVRSPKKGKQVVPEPKYVLFRSAVYFVIGVAILALTYIQYGLNLEITTLFMYGIGFASLYQTSRILSMKRSHK